MRCYYTEKEGVSKPLYNYGVYVDLCGCFSFTFLFHTDLKDVGFADYTYGNAVPPRRRLRRSYLPNLLNPCGEKPNYVKEKARGYLLQVNRLNAPHVSGHGIEDDLCRLLLAEEVAAERLHETELRHGGLVGGHCGIARGERGLDL